MSDRKTDGQRRWREYELTVADIMSSRVAGRATVEHDASITGRITDEPRQVDVLVRWHDVDAMGGPLAVGCKCLARNVDVTTVEEFIGLLEDVGAERGILVTTKGASPAAHRRIEHAGFTIEVLRLEDLLRWSPAGTVTTELAVAADDLERALGVLEKARMRTRVFAAGESPGAERRIQAFRHYPGGCVDGEVQRRHHDVVHTALDAQDIDYRELSRGVVIDGGTPAHQWVPVAETPYGPLKVLASSEQDLAERVEQLLASLSSSPRGPASNDQ